MVRAAQLLPCSLLRQAMCMSKPGSGPAVAHKLQHCLLLSQANMYVQGVHSVCCGPSPLQVAHCKQRCSSRPVQCTCHAHDPLPLHQSPHPPSCGVASCLCHVRRASPPCSIMQFNCTSGTNTAALLPRHKHSTLHVLSSLFTEKPAPFIRLALPATMAWRFEQYLQPECTASPGWAIHLSACSPVIIVRLIIVVQHRCCQGQELCLNVLLPR